MKKNPFISNTFTSIWLKHFNHSKQAITFGFIKDLSFVKNKYLPLYTNVGKNLTNGVSYTLQKHKYDYKHKVFFLYDIPEYFNINNDLPNSLKLKTIKQYNGYLADLKNYKTLDNYIIDNFSSRSRRVFNKCSKRLELSFNISYIMYYGDNISEDNYNHIFENFYGLLKKRYNEKQINNHFLNHRKWDYLKDLIYPMILKKEASLYVIYNNEKPISISLNYVSENVLFGALTVFNTDFSKFNLGFIDIMKHLEWCINSEMEIFDFSKGDFEYKQRWGNKMYNFEYHILYDSKSIFSSSIAFVIGTYFRFKQFLRERNFHTRFHEILYFLKSKKEEASKNEGFETFAISNFDYEEEALNEVDFNNESFSFLKKPVYDFLFKHEECSDVLKVFQYKFLKNTYYIKGKNISEKIILKK